MGFQPFKAAGKPTPLPPAPTCLPPGDYVRLRRLTTHDTAKSFSRKNIDLAFFWGPCFQGSGDKPGSRCDVEGVVETVASRTAELLEHLDAESGDNLEGSSCVTLSILIALPLRKLEFYRTDFRS
jgi:hypothetical protein